ncbi:hypothetical protein OIO90_000118 [Microbotryomycetes sp. JL221]|nr:hypothetical protein OIO90_000118 [Microbotryomycetes sp. JL221]
MSGVVLQDLQESDLRELAEGNWRAFPTFFPPMEADPLPDHEVRLRRCIARLKILLNSPTTFNRKATIDGNLVGIALWNKPGAPVHNLKRRIIQDMDGLTKPLNEDENWLGLTSNWEKTWSTWDHKRAELMQGKPHWYLAPIWVLPEYQNRGIAGKLLQASGKYHSQTLPLTKVSVHSPRQEVIDMADSTSPSTPIYLEASKDGAPIYARRGFQAVGDSEYVEMIRWGKK